MIRPLRPAPKNHRRRRQRGVTLLEIMLSLAVVLVGMLALFRVLSVASKGTSRGQRFIQAQARAQQIIENIRTAATYGNNVLGMPPGVGASIAQCLIGYGADQWSICEAQCKAALPAGASQQACMFVSLNYDNQNIDSSQQVYVVVPDPTPFALDDHTTWLNVSAFSPVELDIQVTIGWNEDDPLNPAPTLWPTAAATPQPPGWHAVTLRSAVFAAQ